jgi:ribosomal protein S27AE
MVVLIISVNTETKVPGQVDGVVAGSPLRQRRHDACTDDGMTADIRSAPKERICPECGGVVADSDPVCPHCGATLVGG